jgi:hypothetical protein
MDDRRNGELAAAIRRFQEQVFPTLIRLASVDANYAVRLEPAAIVEALRTIRSG